MTIKAASRSLLIVVLVLALMMPGCDAFRSPRIAPPASNPTTTPVTSAEKALPTEVPTRAPTTTPSPVPTVDPLVLAPETVGNARLLMQLGIGGGIKGPPTRLAWSPDGKRLAVIRSRDVAILDGLSLEEVASLPVVEASDLAFGASGQLYLLHEQEMQVWDIDRAAQERTLPLKQPIRPRRLAIDPAQQLAAVLGVDGVVINLLTGEERFHIQGVAPEGDPTLFTVIFSKDSKQLIASGYTGLHTWDVSTGKLIRRLGPGGLTRLRLVDTWLAAGGQSEIVYLVHRSNGQVFQLKASDKGMWSRALDISGDGKWLATGWDDGRVRVYAVSSRQAVLEFDPGEYLDPNEARHVRDLAFQPGSSRLAILNDDGAVRLWSIESVGQISENREGSVPAFAHFNLMAVDAKGRRLAAANADGLVYLWDLHARRPISPLTIRQGLIVGLSFSNDGQQLAVGTQSNGAKNGITIWDVPSGKLVQTLNDEGQVVFANQPGLLAVGAGRRPGLRLWDLNTGQLQRTLLPDVRLVDFRLRGEPYLLMTLEADGKIRQWDLDTNRPREVYEAAEVFRTMAFSQYGWVAGGGQDNIWLWDTRSVLNPPAQLTGPKGWVNTLDFAPGGGLLASGGDDGIVRLWDTKSQRPVRSLEPLRGPVKQLLFFDQGRRLAYIGLDGLVYVWGLK